MTIFNTSPLTQFSKFNNFLWVFWFLGKNLSNFVPSVWKLHNPHCHSTCIYNLFNTKHSKHKKENSRCTYKFEQVETFDQNGLVFEVCMTIEESRQLNLFWSLESIFKLILNQVNSLQDKYLGSKIHLQWSYENNWSYLSEKIEGSRKYSFLLSKAFIFHSHVLEF